MAKKTIDISMYEDFTIDKLKNHIDGELSRLGYSSSVQYTFSFELDYSGCYYESDSPSITLRIKLDV